MANATVINPADGTENNAAPHTEVTSINVPINSAINLPFMVPAASKRPARHVAREYGDDSIRGSVGKPDSARFRSRVQPPRPMRDCVLGDEQDYLLPILLTCATTCARCKSRERA